MNTPYRDVHPNSVEAYYGLDLEPRQGKIFALLVEIARPLTDYQILKRLFPDSGDPNMVRPRITELIQDPGVPVESLFSVRSFKTGCWNRMAEFVPRSGQVELPFGLRNEKA